MDLKEFVSETLKQIFEGVTTAQDEVKAMGGRINPNLICNNATNIASPNMVIPGEVSTTVTNVDFDVALTVTETSGKAGKAGLTVWSMGAGVEGSSQTTNSTVSRVKFLVHAVLPISQQPVPEPATNSPVTPNDLWGFGFDFTWKFVDEFQEHFNKG